MEEVVARRTNRRGTAHGYPFLEPSNHGEVGAPCLGPHRFPRCSPAPACFTVVHVGVAHGVSPPSTSCVTRTRVHARAYRGHEARRTSGILQYARHNPGPPPRWSVTIAHLQSL